MLKSEHAQIGSLDCRELEGAAGRAGAAGAAGASGAAGAAGAAAGAATRDFMLSHVMQLTRPTAQAVEGLSGLLGEIGLAHLTLEHMSLASLAANLAAGRPAFLLRLKSLGVVQLVDRQAISNALARAVREGRLDVAPDAGVGQDDLCGAESSKDNESALDTERDCMTGTFASCAGDVGMGVGQEMPRAAWSSAELLETSEVMQELRRGRPVSALQHARALVDTATSQVLLGRALAAMGSLTAARQSYERAQRGGDQAVARVARAEADEVSETETALDGEGEMAALLPAFQYVTVCRTL